MWEKGGSRYSGDPTEIDLFFGGGGGVLAAYLAKALSVNNFIIAESAIVLPSIPSIDKIVTCTR